MQWYVSGGNNTGYSHGIISRQGTYALYRKLLHQSFISKYFYLKTKHIYVVQFEQTVNLILILWKFVVFHVKKELLHFTRLQAIIQFSVPVSISQR